MPSGATFNDPDASSVPTAPLDRRALQLEKLRGLTQTEGILLIVLGVLALAFPVIASAGVTLMVALAFLIGGILGWVDNLRRARAVSRLHTFGRLVVATLFLITGLWILIQFKAGLVPAAQQIKALATALGILASYWLDASTAGCIVLVQSALFVTALVLAPRHGLLARRRRLGRPGSGSPPP